MKVGTDSVLLGAWVDVDGVTTVLDAGAGSGILSLMIAQRAPQASVTAVELDSAAAEAAEANIAASPWAERCRVVCADMGCYNPTVPPDLIICNPPFFTGGIPAPDRRRASARHAATGFGPLSVIDFAARWLAPKGSLAMITPAVIADDIVFEAEMQRMDIWRMCRVATTSGRPASRILWQLSRKGVRSPAAESCLDVHSHGEYTDAYRTLTSDFYLHLR